MKQKLIISALLILLLSVFILPFMTGSTSNIKSEETDTITTTEETIITTTTEASVDNISQTTTETTTNATVTELIRGENTIEESSTGYNTQNNTDIEDDLFYLAAAVCREAGGESEEVQMLVANVIINRVNSPLYPNTIYDVLTQPGQYGTMHQDGVSFPSWADKNIKTQCYNVANRILNGERVCPTNVIFQAEFKQGSGVYKQIGNMYFCYI